MTLRRRVLVTRPEPGASKTARRLAAAGFEPVVMPLSQVRPLPIRPLAVSGFAAIALTSANAVRHLPETVAAICSDRPLFVVGEATARAARAAGLTLAGQGAGDGSGLAALIAERVPSGATVLYPCGRPRDGELERVLEARGISVEAVEIYETVACDIADADIAQAARPGPLDMALVYSAESARHLSRLASSEPGRQLLAGTRVLAISDKCASSLSGSVFGGIGVAERPDEDAMFDLLTTGD
jgi:uroporphyrinogen-III synthase